MNRAWRRLAAAPKAPEGEGTTRMNDDGAPKDAAREYAAAYAAHELLDAEMQLALDHLEHQAT